LSMALRAEYSHKPHIFAVAEDVNVVRLIVMTA